MEGGRKASEKKEGRNVEKQLGCDGGREGGGREGDSKSFVHLTPLFLLCPFSSSPCYIACTCFHNPIILFLISQELCACFCSRWRMAWCHLVTAQ